MPAATGLEVVDAPALAALLFGEPDAAGGGVAVDNDGIVATAAATSLTAYDASYLWHAHRLGAGLITHGGET